MQASWTVSGSALTPGTPKWSLTSDGLTVEEIIQTVPDPDGLADFLSIKQGQSGPATIRAVTMDGTPGFVSPTPSPYLGHVVPDPFGGAVVQTSSAQIVSINGLTGHSTGDTRRLVESETLRYIEMEPFL